jgi:hypothetical protein
VALPSSGIGFAGRIAPDFSRMQRRPNPQNSSRGNVMMMNNQNRDHGRAATQGCYHNFLRGPPEALRASAVR